MPDWVPDDVDGIIAFGDTPPSDVLTGLGTEASDVGFGFATDGSIIAAE